MVSEQERPGMFATPGVEPRGFKDSKNLKLYHERTGIPRHFTEREKKELREASADQEYLSRRWDPNVATDYFQGASAGPVDQTSAVPNVEQRQRRKSAPSQPQRTPLAFSENAHSHRPRQQWREALGPKVPSYTRSKPLPLVPEQAAADAPIVNRSAAHLDEQRKALRTAFPRYAPQDPPRIRRKPLSVPHEGSSDTNWRVTNPTAQAPHDKIRTETSQENIRIHNIHPRLNDETSIAGRDVPSDGKGVLDDEVQSLPRHSRLTRLAGPPRIDSLDLYTGPSIHKSVLGSTPPKEWFTYPEMGKRPAPPPRIPTMKVDSGEPIHEGVSEFLTSDRESVEPFAKDMPTAAALVKSGVKSFIGSQKRR
ncbi:hypothetical protein K491DRAFT_715822 [Lophiostoma macrostomum CBS 122681]|uniref:Uncharacterized protein n=1 Tax=Lophiostoma macrostomum CBS 122681 TaxID=1314788 RepID=A0A6A6T9J2_9PLEO|nr:hypothetical protein K491DRAFT_715822 [Lophiostoma macrostomum CBS 122681]